MTCHELAERILSIQPDLDPTSVARLSLLLLNSVDDSDQLYDDDTLDRLWKSVSFRLSAAADQHAAMTGELQDLACPPGLSRMSITWQLMFSKPSSNTAKSPQGPAPMMTASVLIAEFDMACSDLPLARVPRCALPVRRAHDMF